MELVTDHEFSPDDWKQLPDMQRGFHITALFHKCRSPVTRTGATNHNAARNQSSALAVYILCLSGEVVTGDFWISLRLASSSEAERTVRIRRGYLVHVTRGIRRVPAASLT